MQWTRCFKLLLPGFLATVDCTLKLFLSQVAFVMAFIIEWETWLIQGSFSCLGLWGSQIQTTSWQLPLGAGTHCLLSWPTALQDCQSFECWDFTLTMFLLIGLKPLATSSASVVLRCSDLDGAMLLASLGLFGLQATYCGTFSAAVIVWANSLNKYSLVYL